MNDINLYPFSIERKSNDIIKMPDNKIPGTDSFDIKMMLLNLINMQ